MPAQKALSIDPGLFVVRLRDGSARFFRGYDFSCLDDDGVMVFYDPAGRTFSLTTREVAEIDLREQA